MSVSNVTSAVIRIGDGVTVAFAFDIEAIDAASIKVGYIEGITVVNADPLTYSVAMNVGLTGGTVTFLAAPVTGKKIYIFRQTDKTQVVSVSRQQSYNPSVVERVWDKLTLISQELKRDVDRAVKTGPDADPDQLITAIETARQEAAASATAAAGSAQLANDWAQKAENVPVVAGQFSALHHAAKALASATAAAASETAAAASAASADFKNFGYGITGNAPLIANLDTAGLASGIYRFDGTTLGTFPAGVVAADTGIVIIDRMDADDERMTLFHATSEVMHSRRRVAGALQSWVVRGSGLASQALAEAGADNASFMSSLRTKQQIDFRLATLAEAQTGTDNTKLLTPLRLRDALQASGSAPVFAARAWVNFNGTGTVAIRASGNVSSITDNGTGDYTVNFVTAMPDADYAVVGLGQESVSGDAGAARLHIRRVANALQSSGVRVAFGSGGTFVDPTIASVAIFR